MRTLLPVVLLLTAATITSAADDPKPRPVTPKEARDGWLSLFDGESLFGWTALNDSKWHVFRGQLYPEAKVSGPLVSNSEWNEFELEMEFQVKDNNQVEFRAGCDHKGEASSPLGIVKLSSYGGWMTLKATMTGGRLIHRFESSGLLGNVASATFPPEGPDAKPVGRGHLSLAGNGLIVRKIKLKPFGTKSLFNGKDLTGWKEFKGDKYKSKFTVTKDGEINVKDGPGDLQSEGQWADFVLQLECVSNGKHLNSGVFFRAIPGEYQQGYEAQVRNEFKDEATQEYTVEIYDPKSNELKEKVKVKSPAVDFGTGAIYRRQPARLGVAKDGEWFTMTVLANGRHLATWVDGVQVTDWVDHRPIDKNARNGCCMSKGAISFQGHDPTTDLSFRNIRIADLTATK